MIVLSKKLFAVLITYAKSLSPEECCGYLLGYSKTIKPNVNSSAILKVNIAVDVFNVKNIHPNPQLFFTFSPTDQLRVFRIAKEKKLKIIGIFRSHPNSPPFPSKQDCKYLYESPQSYCIISLRPIAHITSFRVETKEKIIKIKRDKINFSNL